MQYLWEHHIWTIWGKNIQNWKGKTDRVQDAWWGDIVIGFDMGGTKCVGAKTLAMIGEKASKLSELCDVTIKVPETETYKVQELHLPVYHYLCAEVERNMF